MKKMDSSELWKKFQFLGEKQGAIKLKDLSFEMGLSEEDTLVYLRQVFPMGTGLEIYHRDEDCWVDIKGDSIQYMLSLTPSEWIALHQVLSSGKKDSSLHFQSLYRKVADNGPVKVIMDLLNHLESWGHELNEREHKYADLLNKPIELGQLIQLSTDDDKNFTTLPKKLLHLEGQLTLVAEDYVDHCLIIIPLKKIKNLKVLEVSKESKITSFEVEEFIAAVRAMNEKETRLILKIHNPEGINLFPDHQFLGKPCMITNPAGDLIWAAYVEPSAALFEWLLSQGKNIEILDPVKFKEEYFSYCEEKLRKIA